MPRQVIIVAPPSLREPLLADIERIDSAIGIQLDPGGSRVPEGDVITITGDNDLTRDIYALVEQPAYASVSITTTELRSLRSSSGEHRLAREPAELSWRELEFFLRKETNPTHNFFLLMALSGAIAAIGLWQDVLHIVVGAMILAPGSEPILRMPFALFAPREHAMRGAISTVAGYLAVAAGGLALTLSLALMDPTKAVTLQDQQWIAYWTTISPTSWMLGIIGGIAGAITLAADRPVFTAGVMIALALIPSMTIIGMALGIGNLSLALAGLMRWLVDLVTVAAAGGAVFALKWRYGQRRSVATATG